MTVEKKMMVLEEFIHKVTHLNQSVSDFLPRLIENTHVSNLQKLIIQRESADRQRDFDIEMQLLHTELPKGVYLSDLPLKQKLIVQKYKKLKKPFIPMNTLEFLCSLGGELKSTNDDLPEKILNLNAYNFDPLVVQSTLACYLHSLVFGYFEINKLKSNEDVFCRYFKSIQMEAKSFVDKINEILLGSKPDEMKHYFDTYITKDFSIFIEFDA